MTGANSQAADQMGRSVAGQPKFACWWQRIIPSCGIRFAVCWNNIRKSKL